LRARRHVSNQLLPFGAPSSKSTRLKSMNRWLMIIQIAFCWT
jgi:hypothetical protein